MRLPIVIEPHPILHRKTKPVEELTPAIQRLIDDMIETMHSAPGVGLAANQVGAAWDILVASPDGVRGKELVLLNAHLVEKRGEVVAPEGCLSLPGISASVVRASEVVAEGLDRHGNPVTVKAQGLLARILQHETDHLAGWLYLDRLPHWEKTQLLQRYRRSR